MRTEHLLVLSRVAKAYRAISPGPAATTDVLRGLTLRLRAGELASVHGPRGSGKTTLLLCAAGMLRIDSGVARWPLLPRRPDGRPERVAYVCERPPAHGFLTVRESLAYAVTVCELRASGSARSTAELIDAMELGAVADVRRALLAPEQHAVVQLAIALVASPGLLLVDGLLGGGGAGGVEAMARCLSRVAASGVGVLWAAEFPGRQLVAPSAYALSTGRLSRVSRHGTSEPAQVPAPSVTGQARNAPGVPTYPVSR